jgi:hypothetical protein
MISETAVAVQVCKKSITTKTQSHQELLQPRISRITQRGIAATKRAVIARSEATKQSLHHVEIASLGPAALRSQ